MVLSMMEPVEYKTAVEINVMNVDDIEDFTNM